MTTKIESCATCEGTGRYPGGLDPRACRACDGCGTIARTIGERINAEIAAIGIPPVTDAQIRATLANVAQAHGSLVAAAWIGTLDGDNTHALAWLLSPRSRTHCEHGIPYAVDCIRCGPPAF